MLVYDVEKDNAFIEIVNSAFHFSYHPFKQPPQIYFAYICYAYTKIRWCPSVSCCVSIRSTADFHLNSPITSPAYIGGHDTHSPTLRQTCRSNQHGNLPAHQSKLHDCKYPSVTANQIQAYILISAASCVPTGLPVTPTADQGSVCHLRQNRQHLAEGVDNSRPNIPLPLN